MPIQGTINSTRLLLPTHPPKQILMHSTIPSSAPAKTTPQTCFSLQHTLFLHLSAPPGDTGRQASEAGESGVLSVTSGQQTPRPRAPVA